MFHSPEVLDVGVSRRILWIGSAAYPLSNIARAQTIEIAPNRARAVRVFLGEVLAVLALGWAATTAAGLVRVQVASRSDLRQIVLWVVLGLLVLAALRLLVTVWTRTYYAMVIETAGSPRTALVSRDRAEVLSLVRRTMEAIDDPAADFHQQVHHHISIGEQYNIAGKGNIGKGVPA